MDKLKHRFDLFVKRRFKNKAYRHGFYPDLLRMESLQPRPDPVEHGGLTDDRIAGKVRKHHYDHT